MIYIDLILGFGKLWPTQPILLIYCLFWNRAYKAVEASRFGIWTYCRFLRTYVSLVTASPEKIPFVGPEKETMDL